MISPNLLDLNSIRHLRRKIGISQKNLAELAGVSQSFIAKVESGRIDPSLSHANKIAKALAAYSPKELLIKDVMSKKVISFSPQTKLSRVLRILKTEGISQAPVVDKGLVVGMVTESSLLEHVSHLSNLLVEEVMSQAHPQLASNTPVSSVIPILRVYSSVLVVERGHLQGILTKVDVLNATYTSR